MKTPLSSKEITSYLKGLAIIAVAVNHYINRYLSNSFEWYANGIVSIFFILSGYGLYYSLGKYNNLTINNIKDFFYKRFSRIYPLYLISLVLVSIVEHKHYSLSVYFAIPFVKAPGIYWFVTFLLQCYLITPLLFLILKKLGSLKTMALILMLMTVTHAISFSIGFLPSGFTYRHMFLGHIFLFSLGYCLPAALKENRFISSQINLILSIILFVSTVHLTRYNSMPANTYSLVLSGSLILSSLYFVSSALSGNIVIPFAKAINTLGNYSYSIYLFHLFYYLLLAKVGLIKYGNFYSIMITLVLFPIFLLTCCRIEKTVNNLVLKATNI